MQEKRYDGSEVITNQVTEDELRAAFGNPANKSVGVYPADSKITIAGTNYIVDEHGSFRRVKE